MRKFASVPPRIWQADLKAVRGDLEAIAVHYHLTTSSHANMLGLYYVPVAYIAHEIGISQEGASKGLRSLIQADLCAYDFDKDLVWVRDMASDQIAPHLSPKDKRVKGIAEQLAMLPICAITLGFFQKYRVPYHLHEERCLEEFEVISASPFEAPSKPLRSKEKEKDKEKDLGEGQGTFCSGDVETETPRETMFRSFPTPSSASEARTILIEKGVPQSSLDECVRLMMGGNFGPYELEGVLEATRKVA
jgi:hypothetical protein